MRRVDATVEQRIRASYAAFGRGDLDAAITLFTDDARYVNPPEAIEGGVREGRDGVMKALRSLHDQFAQQEVVVDELRSGPDGVLLTGHFRGAGRVSGAPLAMDFHHVLRLRDGRVEALEWYLRRDEAARAAGL
jgi:ketosteroid isomerase-like protein